MQNVEVNIQNENSVGNFRYCDHCLLKDSGLEIYACIECEQKLCEQCYIEHENAIDQVHKIVKIGVENFDQQVNGSIQNQIVPLQQIEIYNQEQLQAQYNENFSFGSQNSIQEKNGLINENSNKDQNLQNGVLEISYEQQQISEQQQSIQENEEQKIMKEFEDIEKSLKNNLKKLNVFQGTYTTKCEQIVELREIIYKKQQEEMNGFHQLKKIMTYFIGQYFKSVKEEFTNIMKPYFESLSILQENLKSCQSFNAQQIYDGLQIQKLNSKQKMQIIQQLNENAKLQLEKMQNWDKISSKLQKPLPKFNLNMEYIGEIKQNFGHLINILESEHMNYKNSKELFFNKPMQLQKEMYYYQPELMSVVSYNTQFDKFSQINIVKPENNEQMSIPKYCQPVHFNKTLYLMGCMQIDPVFNIHIPMKEIYAIKLNDGQIRQLKEQKIAKAKSCIIKGEHSQEIYQFGGIITNDRLRVQTCEKYDIVNNQWTKLCNMNKIRVQAQACFIKETQKIYVFGGMSEEKKIEKSIEIYDIMKDSWELVEVKNKRQYIPRHMGFCSNLSQNQIVIMGGFSEYKVDRSRRIQVYDLSTNKILDYGELLPCGIALDSRCTEALGTKQEFFILNSFVSQTFPCTQQRSQEIFVMKISANNSKIFNIYKP